METILYPQRPHKKKDFKGCKVFTIPSQSLTLKEIIQRFIRREALPVAKDGVYNTTLGDLEKLATEDITVQMERVQEIKENIGKAAKRMKDAEEKRVQAEIERQAAEALAAKAKQANKPDTSPE